MINKINKIGKRKNADIAVAILLFLTAFCVVWTSCLNPFGLSRMDTDTSVYLTIAQGITRGFVPFRDFFDNKGPLLYLMSALGMFFGRFAGVWITELLLMLVSVFFAYKTARFFGDRFQSLAGTICALLVFQQFFYEVAGTEEYSLPFMMISLYIFTKYYFTERNPNRAELLALGACFAASVLIRINMFSLWLGFCAVIFVQLILRGEYAALGNYVLFFVCGMLIVCVPTFLYLALNGAFKNYIAINFLSGTSRAFTGFGLKDFIKSFFEIVKRDFCYVPLAVGIVWIAKNLNAKRAAFSIAYTLAFILTVAFHAVIRTSFPHYNMVLVPFLVPAFTFAICRMMAAYEEIKHKEIFVLIAIFFAVMMANTAVFAVFILCAMQYLNVIKHKKEIFAVLCLCVIFNGDLINFMRDAYGIVKAKSRQDLMDLGKTIDANTNADDTFIFLGFPCHPYLFTERNTASRYIYQQSGFEFLPDAAKEEFVADMQNNRPAIIAIENIGDGYRHLTEWWYAPIYDMIENDYEMLSSDNGYFLFKRKR